jgi:hypothetical protein
MSDKYQPKGSMCVSCDKKIKDCSKLPFDKMEQCGGVKLGNITISTYIVICSAWERVKLNKAGSE